MVSLEEFENMAREIADTLPEEFYRELNGGLIVQEKRKLHPASVDDNLCILGEYHRDKYLGRFIVLYYGSYMQIYGHLSRSDLSKRLRKTILHEFRHHLESLAGEKELEVEDAIEIAEYKRRNG
ncbi:metallopeptidase family protein [Murimonas intestini]|uniref:Zn-dependent protease with MMP-like domain n=1 Tax=Murimonas intestini TaxID=1337051 RepID=A0AB73T3E9_9FIRM|nr:metallopeptidase family protein [Murimonas intestini]MCR1841072.1 metallopeptidase family protein [Murimonas intestini]MCR1865810.1 metallopeptidase family protein [Murimonas intestini]MCR1883230.1 metallopeptidase family protein [Murimonas intestini]